VAGAGGGQDGDDGRHEERGDGRGGYRAGPVEARGRGTRGERDVQARAGRDFLGELAVAVAGGGVAGGVGDGQCRQGRGGGCGWADEDPGGELAAGLPRRGVSAGVMVRQAGGQDCQFFAGAGAQGLPGSLVELAGCDLAGREGLARRGRVPAGLDAFSVADPGQGAHRPDG
jgi:hypothetical protein